MKLMLLWLNMGTKASCLQEAPCCHNSVSHCTCCKLERRTLRAEVARQWGPQSVCKSSGVLTLACSNGQAAIRISTKALFHLPPSFHTFSKAKVKSEARSAKKTFLVQQPRCEGSSGLLPHLYNTSTRYMLTTPSSRDSAQQSLKISEKLEMRRSEPKRQRSIFCSLINISEGAKEAVTSCRASTICPPEKSIPRPTFQT